MGTTTNDLNLVDQVAEAQTPEEIERAITVRRSHADRVARELDRRRHHLTDWRWQMTHRGWTIAIAAGAALVAAGALIAVAVARSRARRRPVARLTRLRRAVARMIDQPERVAATSTIGQKVGVTALGTLASAGIKLMVQRFEPSHEPRPHEGG